jgi:hypothetical protein
MSWSVTTARTSRHESSVEDLQELGVLRDGDTRVHASEIYEMRRAPAERNGGVDEARWTRYPGTAMRSLVITVFGLALGTSAACGNPLRGSGPQPYYSFSKLSADGAEAVGKRASLSVFRVTVRGSELVANVCSEGGNYDPILVTFAPAQASTIDKIPADPHRCERVELEITAVTPTVRARLIAE